MSETGQRGRGGRTGFTLIELAIVVAVVVIMSGIGIPALRASISSQRLQQVAWQMVQDLRTVRADAILYQQDLNAYINYSNSPVDPHSAANTNNRSYWFETFQWGKDQTVQVENQHYVPVPVDAAGSHFASRVLQYGVVIESITTTGSSVISSGGKNYFVLCFRSGAGMTFRGEGDLVFSMGGTDARTNSTLGMIGIAKLVIKLRDPSTGKFFYVIVDGTGKTSMYGSLP
jgi:prepilin-type N-terminal cleavage/methylation domain-containing protein